MTNQTNHNSHTQDKQKTEVNREKKIAATITNMANSTATGVNFSGAAAKGMNATLPPTMKYTGKIAEIVTDAIHNPSGNIIEKAVCGTVKVLAQGAAMGPIVGPAIVEGANAIPIPNPYAKAAGGIAGAIIAAPIAEKATKPVGEAVGKACHVLFDRVLGSEAKENQKKAAKQTLEEKSIYNPPIKSCQSNLPTLFPATKDTPYFEPLADLAKVHMMDENFKEISPSVTQSKQKRQRMKNAEGVGKKMMFAQPLAADTAIPLDLPNTTQKAEKAIDELQSSLKELIHTWCSKENNIQGYESCPEIVGLSEKLKQSQTQNTPVSDILKLSNDLKDAKVREQANRLHFDDSLQTVDGLVNLGSAASLFSGNARLAHKVVTGGKALASIGRQVGALAGLGTLAATINPVMAVGTIALNFADLLSIFADSNDSAMSTIHESLQEIKMMVEQLRQEMHARFDRLETKLDKIHLDLAYRIEQIQLQNETTQFLIKKEGRTNQRSHDLSHQFLESVQQKIDALHGIVREERMDRELHAITDPIRKCLNSIQLQPTPEQYEKWLGEFQLYLEASAYSPILSGDPARFDNRHASTWHLDGQLPSEASFYVNSLLAYLGEHFPQFANYPKQPNVLLWAYPSLAILRLIFLTNNNDMGLIRREEFNVLELIAKKAQDIQSFYHEIKNKDITRKLVEEYHQSFLNVAKEMKTFLDKFLMEKNDFLNQQLRLRYKAEWARQSEALTTKDISPRTDYPNWFKAWTNCHYLGGGASHEASNRVTAKHKSNYLAVRNHQLNVVKKKRSLPNYVNQKGFHGAYRDELAMHRTDFPHLCIFSENPDEPVLHLSDDEVSIDIAIRLDVPDECIKAEYLGLGQLTYRYRVEASALRITAYFMMADQFYPIRSIECDFDLGPYERREGILWGWIGDTGVRMTQAGPARWYGSTGESKHWFDSYGTIPVISAPDAGPMKSLANPDLPNARSFRKITDPLYEENILRIRDDIQNKKRELIDYESKTAVKEQVLSECNPLSAALTACEASWQRLNAFLMLALPNCYEKKDSMEFLFGNTNDFYSPSQIRQSIILSQTSPSIIEKLLGVEFLDIDRTTLELSKLMETHKGKTNDPLFDQVYAQIMDAHAFYKDRIDETGTYQDIFEKAEETKHRYEQTTSLLNIICSSVAKEVTDPKARARIVQDVEKKMAQQNINLNFDGDLPSPESKKGLQRSRSNLQKFSFLNASQSGKNTTRLMQSPLHQDGVSGSHHRF